MRVTERLSVVCGIVGVVVAIGWFHGVSAQNRNPAPGRPATATPAAATPAAADTGISIALTGDSIITQKLSVYTEPSFTKMIELIRGADVAFTNLEMLFHDYEPYPMTQSGGTYMRADPALAREIAWAGFDMVGRANNHANDYGVEGIRLTTKYTAEAGLVQAGVGESLEEAREPRYFDSAKGRVALISVASTFPDPTRAGRSFGVTRARPGLNPLRFTTTSVVTRPQFDALRSALIAAGEIRAPQQPAAGQEAPNQMTALGRRFVVGEKQEVRTEPLKEDLDEIAANVKNASRQADYTIVTVHTHEGGADRFAPPEFLLTFARAMVDAGADMVTGTGPHLLRGIEIYKGKPILYCLGDFMFQNETVLRMPPENYEPLGLGHDAGVADFNDRRYDMDRTGFPADEYIWESVVAMPRFVGKTLTELKLYPITLGYRQSRIVRGRPKFADLELSRKIIADLTRLSTPFGTKVEFRDGIGIVTIGTTSP